MVLKIYMFGVAKEIFGNRYVEFTVDNTDRISVEKLKSLLEEQRPRMKDIGSYLIAANNEYTTDKYIIYGNEEIAVIPPVSGG
ncbi:MAG: MoaD/ThiS family protein [Bacteroidetes bacterium]|nr:MoaD/ThiS family protein [Bacteroidota bacterium]